MVTQQSKESFFDSLEKRSGNTEEDLIRMMAMLSSKTCNNPPPRVIYLPDRNQE